MIIDCHGHYTTAPKALENWRNAQIAGIQDPGVMPRVADLRISDDELRESIASNQLRLMQERGSDLTIFSPRASFMAHHIGDFEVSSTWAAICNELCFRVAQLFPDHFIPAAMLPQSPGVDPATCIPELVKCVEQYGNVAINLNPDPSGGHWTSPPLSDRHWYPVYEKMVEYDIPAMVHVSTSCNACLLYTSCTPSAAWPPRPTPCPWRRWSRLRRPGLRSCSSSAQAVPAGSSAPACRHICWRNCRPSSMAPCRPVPMSC